VQSYSFVHRLRPHALAAADLEIVVAADEPVGDSARSPPDCRSCRQDVPLNAEFGEIIAGAGKERNG
jgi:hypothetical protein